MQKIQDDIIKLWNVVKSQPEISEEQKNRIKALYDGAVRSLHKAPDSRLRPGVPRSCRSSSQFLRPQISSITPVSTDKSVVLQHCKVQDEALKSLNRTEDYPLDNPTCSLQSRYFELSMPQISFP
ncbi:hypothetical protein BGY98DRAFT_326903 [Russula aff. rugulosa BPL654]|nr:hypothetical protein BGY98DRAFT_326903 [Russula aff. rugulosa BPL654]